MRRVLSAVVLAGAILLASTLPAQAAVTVTPSKVELQVAPGSSATFTVNVINGEAKSLTVTASTWDFARDARGVPQPVSASDAANFRGCATWLRLAQPPKTVKSGKSVAIVVSVQVPQSARWGSYNAYLKAVAAPTVRRGTVSIAYAVNALIVVTVAPTGARISGPGATPLLTRTVSISRVVAPSAVGNEAVPLQAVLENAGNVHADMRTHFEVLQGGKIVYRTPVNKFTLLPGDKYPVAASWDKPALLGTFTVRFIADDGSGKLMSKGVGFWVVSWTAVLLGISAVLFTFVLILMFRRYVHIEFRRAGAQPATE